MASVQLVALGIASGYLLGLSLLGYICLLGVIKSRCSQRQALSFALIALHLSLGLAAMVLVPSVAYGALRTHLPNEFGFAFAIATLLTGAVAFYVASQWNRRLAGRLPA